MNPFGMGRKFNLCHYLKCLWSSSDKNFFFEKVCIWKFFLQSLRHGCQTNLWKDKRKSSLGEQAKTATDRGCEHVAKVVQDQYSQGMQRVFTGPLHRKAERLYLGCQANEVDTQHGAKRKYQGIIRQAWSGWFSQQDPKPWRSLAGLKTHPTRHPTILLLVVTIWSKPGAMHFKLVCWLNKGGEKITPLHFRNKFCIFIQWLSEQSKNIKIGRSWWNVFFSFTKEGFMTLWVAVRLVA